MNRLSLVARAPFAAPVVGPLVVKRHLLGFGKPSTSKAHNPGKISYGADRWQTKLKDIPPPKANVKANNKPALDPGTYSARFPALSQAFPGTPRPSSSNPLSAPSTRVTTLENGIKVASEDAYNQICTVGVLFQAGLKDEPPKVPGVSFMLETMAFKDTETRTREQLSILLQEIGGHVGTFSDRESISFQIEILRDKLPLAVEILADTLLRMKFTDADIAAQAEAFQNEVAASDKDPAFLLQNAMFATAYPNPGLGRTLQNSSKELAKLTAQDLQDFINTNMVGQRLTIAGASVEHDEFVRIVNSNFGSVPSLPADKAKVVVPSPSYHGGFTQIVAHPEMEFAYFSLLFEIPGWVSHKDSVVVAVLHKMLGGGSSFSSGGPGKGMHSRLYTRVLNKHWWSEACEGVALALSDTGLFGISSTCRESKKYFAQCAQVTAKELTSLLLDPIRQPEEFAEDLSRAKNQLKTSMFMNLEHRTILYDDIGRQVQLYGHRFDPSTLSEMIDDVTAQDVITLMKKVLRSTPTMVAIAPKRDLDMLERTMDYEQFKEFFQAAVKHYDF